MRNETPTNLYNPLLSDYSVMLADDNNVPHEYTIRSQEIQVFPKYIADHIKKKLAEKIYLDRTGGKQTKESIMPDILSEIEVEI